MPRVDNAEAVAIRISQHHVVSVLRVAPIHLGGAQADEALNFRRLRLGALRVEVHVVPLMRFGVGAHELHGQLHAWALARHEHDPGAVAELAFPRIARYVVERGLPEADGGFELLDAPDDGGQFEHETLWSIHAATPLGSRPLFGPNVPVPPAVLNLRHVTRSA